MRRLRLPLVAAAVIAIAAVYAFGFEAATLQARLVRNIVASALQIATPLIALAGCLSATRGYARGDTERVVWSTAAVGVLSWTGGRAAFAFAQWAGGTALPYPSAADAFFVAFYVLLATALVVETRLVLPMVDRPVRLTLLGIGIAGWVVAFVYVLEPILQSPVSAAHKVLAVFYPTAAVFLIPAGLMPAIGFRGGTSAYPWLAIAVAAVCLALASLGYAFLTWYNLYSDVHSINALWIAGFIFLALGAFWQRVIQEEV